MANKQISQLPFVGNTGYTSDDVMAIVNYDVSSGTTKQTLITDFKDYVTSGLTSSYKVYTALLSQNGGSNPNPIVLENTLSGPISWSRLSTGSYKGTLTGEFPDSDKVAIFVNQAGFIPLGGGDSVYTYMYVNDSDSVVLDTLVSSNYQDGMLNKTTIEIRVYP